MTKIFSRIIPATLLVAASLLAGCDQQDNAHHIKVGVINGAEQDIAEVAKQVAKEKYGLDVELVGFSGSLLPNEPTEHKELDANVFQHRPFLAQDNKAAVITWWPSPIPLCSRWPGTRKRSIRYQN